MKFSRLILLTVLGLLVAAGCIREEPELSGNAMIECEGCDKVEEFIMCVDGDDNDGDGLIDCEDPDCEGIGCCGLSGPEDNDEACSDGCDNDGNGYLDCADFSCSKSTTVTACKSEIQTDENTPLTCSDGLDNDWNGYFDCSDFSCMESEEVTFCEGNDKSCSDGIDNDGNGFIDCKDYGCSRSTKVTVCE
jgi:hypothetical protein